MNGVVHKWSHAVFDIFARPLSRFLLTLGKYVKTVLKFVLLSFHSKLLLIKKCLFNMIVNYDCKLFKSNQINVTFSLIGKQIGKEAYFEFEKFEK